MKTTILAGLSEARKEEIRKDFEASGAIRERFAELAQAKIDSARKASIVKDSYESPNWAFLQADTNGYIRALEELISLLK